METPKSLLEFAVDWTKECVEHIDKIDKMIASGEFNNVPVCNAVHLVLQGASDCLGIIDKTRFGTETSSEGRGMDVASKILVTSRDALVRIYDEFLAIKGSKENAD